MKILIITGSKVIASEIHSYSIFKKKLPCLIKMPTMATYALKIIMQKESFLESVEKDPDFHEELIKVVNNRCHQLAVSRHDEEIPALASASIVWNKLSLDFRKLCRQLHSSFVKSRAPQTQQ